ncbi:MAG: hypothetical protein WC405_03075 [Syntrophales bacterium]
MNPTWNAIAREAALAAEHLGNGATILGKANYAHHAHYGQAFFSLSTGFERAAKLAFVVDHALTNAGAFPPNEEVRDYGHNLARLLDQADAIAERLGLPANVRLPRSEIHAGIVEVLTDFANNITRYYNLDFITGNPRIAQRDDPTKAWFRLVVTPVLRKHYGSRQQERHRRNAQLISEFMQPITMVRHVAETGEPLDTVFDASLQTGVSEFAKPYVRMYVMQLVRFIGRLLSELGYAAYGTQIETIPHLSEFFAIFNNDDEYFLRRKTWSIYRP